VAETVHEMAVTQQSMCRENGRRKSRPEREQRRRWQAPGPGARAGHEKRGHRARGRDRRCDVFPSPASAHSSSTVLVYKAMALGSCATNTLGVVVNANLSVGLFIINTLILLRARLGRMNPPSRSRDDLF
jgi:hypothetical protein